MEEARELAALIMGSLRTFTLLMGLLGAGLSSNAWAQEQDLTGSTSWRQPCITEPLRQAFTLLDVEDFGPPSLSTDFTGRHWYEWNAAGSSDPSETYDVFVVVHADGAEDLARAEFRDDKRLGLERDFRFRSRSETDAYFDEKIAELTKLAADEPKDAEDSSAPFLLAMVEGLEKLRGILADDVCEIY